jgi:hypothetical protein
MATEGGRNVNVQEVYHIYNVKYLHIFMCICWFYPCIESSLLDYGLFKKWCLYVY